MKVFDHIELSVYKEGSGYSHTSPIEGTEGVMDLEKITYEDYADYIKDYLADINEEDEWYIIDIALYENGKDPMFDEPVKNIKIKAFSKNGEIVIEEM